MGVTPRPRPWVDCTITGTRLPFTTVVPSRFDWNGLVCAMCSAYSGAQRQSTTMTARSPAITSATRFRRIPRRASCHGLAAGIARSPPVGARTSSTIAPLTNPPGVRLLHPGLIDQPVELLAEDEVPDALRHEVEMLRREHRRHRCLVGYLTVDLRPHCVRLREVRVLELERAVHL